MKQLSKPQIRRGTIMAKRYRLGIIGFAHMHIYYLAALFGEHPQVEWVACADTPHPPELRVAPFTRDWNRQQIVELQKIPQVYDDYHEMLRREKLDIVLVTSENAQHPDVVEACAAAGVHVCVEKPMAMSLADGLRMARACQAAGTTLLVNWPITWSGQSQAAKRLLDEGVIGRVLEVKWRSGHTGPLGPSVRHPGVKESSEEMTGSERGATWWHKAATGGGAMIDYCCYGGLVSRWYIGEQATAALGMRANLDSPWGEADDNAVILVRYPSAIALIEGSWTTWNHGVATGPIVYGTEGTLVVDSKAADQSVRVERSDGQTTLYQPDQLPAARDNVAKEMIHHLETGEALHPTLQLPLNLEVMAILDAGIRAADSQKLEVVNSVTWRIG
jgi:predicted dehydrogenase